MNRCHRCHDTIPYRQPANERQRLSHNPRNRSAKVGGDPAESDQLRVRFLVWVGKRSYATALRVAGIEYGHGMKWLAGGILRAEYQALVLKVVD